MKFPHSFKDSYKMTPSEKHTLWHQLQSRLLINEPWEKENVIIPQEVRHRLWGHKNPFSRLFSNNKNMTPIPLIALTIGLIGTTSVMAQSSLPGDFLYGVKIHVNENLKTAFSFSAQSDAHVNLDILETRIKEKEDLSTEWRLDSEMSTNLDAQISTEIKKYNEKRVVLVGNSTDSEVLLNLDTRFSALLWNTDSPKGNSSSKTIIDVSGSKESNTVIVPIRATTSGSIENTLRVGTSTSGWVSTSTSGWPEIGVDTVLQIENDDSLLNLR